jgi:HK97 family phage major capsid protein
MKTKSTVVLSTKSLATDASTLRIKAVVSSQVMDRDGEVVDLNNASFRSIDGVVDIPVLSDHNHGDLKSVLGSVEKAELVDGEMVFDMVFSNKKQDAIDAYYLIADGHLKNAFSIGFQAAEFDGVVYKSIQVFEVSVVSMPSNPRARVLEVMGKSANVELVEAVTKAMKSLEDNENVNEEEITEEIKSEVVSEIIDKDIETTEDEIVEEIIKEEIKTMTPEEVQAKIDEAVKSASEEAVTKAMESLEAKAQEEAAKVAAEKSAADAIVVVKESKEAFTLKSLRAAKEKDYQTLGKMNEEAAKAFNLDTKGVHTYTEMGQAILCEELDRDITRCVETTLGTIGSYVGKYNLTSSNKYSFITLDGSLAYQDIDDCAPKPDGGTLTATKNSKEVREKALQGAVCDNLADDLAIDIYTSLRDEMARAENSLVGDLVFNFAGGSPAEATGILVTPGVPTLVATAADRKVVLRSAVMSLCAGARAGAIWAMNEQTWYDCILPLLDCDQSCSRELSQSGNFGNFIMTLWERPIIIDNTLPNGTIVFGDFRQYYKYVTKGARSIEFSNTAKSDVLNVNGWDRDITLYRSHLRATGVVKQPDAFVVITCS